MKPHVATVALLIIASGTLILSIRWINRNAPPEINTVSMPVVDLVKPPMTIELDATLEHEFAPATEKALPFPMAELKSVIQKTILDENAALSVQPRLLTDFEKLYDMALDSSASEPFFEALYQTINENLPGKAAQAYSQLFEKYADYRAALAEQFYVNQTTELDYSQLDSYRRQYFTNEEIESLFAEKTLLTNLFLETYLNETQQNYSQENSNTEINKWESEIQALDTPLGEALRRDTITEMQANGSDENQILTFRARTEGWEAAEISTQRDRKFAELREKYNDYLSEKAAIEQAGLTSHDKKIQQQALFNRLFNEEEQKALKAIPAVRDLIE